MTSNKTFTMIKPTAYKNNCSGKIIQKIYEGGFHISALKVTKLSKEDAQEFYAIHKDRPFFDGLVEFMSSGPIIAAILEKENAVEDYRTLIGATNPAEATEGTIRKMCGTSIGENAVHGSDSDDNAEIESKFFFSGRERF
ncbi:MULTISPECIES: nucleoside-diphosphate kinase [unclassified Lentimicrobium]|uniref:nucleoside-diphosphate kinase n=1 Tax=unclassified Lentimicrobium TaxID=2677434 RepID=UPI001556C1BC|nr:MULTISPECIES: nucleoside-diphosphate kinase [unclassified Lentimicrobium]NPD45430.1 nucleoside-diphosphate kinase [Lentimicrobium sp. S6]NPD83792.1 nucleoside-diphosphate kinase [Lentimicrobium sp. L6]